MHDVDMLKRIAQRVIRKSAMRFSEIMRKQQPKARWRFNLIPSRFSARRRINAMRR
jgi:hypothetical protein